jgi:cobyrinic acid a,c-diamide synthase
VGHEFHYTRIVDDGPLPPTTWALDKGTGVGAGRDGLRVGSVIATYSHLHALGAPGWAPALVRLATSYAQGRLASTRARGSGVKQEAAHA